MFLFLTSSPFRDCEGDLPFCLNEVNGFVERLRAVWKPDSRCLIIASDPDNFEENDRMAEAIPEVFGHDGLTISECEVLDARTEEKAVRLVNTTDVIILSGGHVPTQNEFFERIELINYIKDFEGVLIGISAGSMNCAEIVYAIPELEGETLDPHYERWPSGLNLTRRMIIPHFQNVKHDVLDGKSVIWEIAFGDSFGAQFLALPDGSYMTKAFGVEAVYGEAYIIEDFTIRQIAGRVELEKVKY